MGRICKPPHFFLTRTSSVDDSGLNHLTHLFLCFPWRYAMQSFPQWFLCCNYAASRRLHGSRRSCVLLSAAVLCLSNLPIHGLQNRFTQIIGNADRGVVLPQSVPLVPRQDPGALTEIQAFRSAISLGPWKDMQGTGQLTSTATDSSGDKSPLNSTLWIRHHHEYRLDIQKPNGTSSLRLDGSYGAAQHTDGHTKIMDARDAVSGMFAFPALMEAAFPDTSVMVIDRGMAIVGGTTLHRITVESPWPGSPVDAATGNLMSSVVDLYFNPQTHLLMKSASAVFGSESNPEPMLEVVTYGEYNAVSGMLLPHSYRQTLNGQILWTLLLNQIQLNSGLTEADFHF